MATKTKNTKAFYKTEIPSDWEVKRLEDACSHFKSGFGITSEQIFESGEYPVYGGNGLRGYTNSFTHDGEYLLIGRQGALCGNIQRVSSKVYISEHAIAVQPNNENDIDFLAYKLEHKNLNRHSESSAQPGLSVEKLIRLKIEFPPLPEQRAIAQVLSTADSAIHTTEKLITQKELRKKWLMQQLLKGKKRLKGFEGEWKEVKLSECLSRMANGITYDTEKRIGIPVTRIETISAGVINFNKIGFADSLDNIEDYRLQKGDILYSHINSLSHIGKVAIYNNEDPLYHGMNLLLLRCNEKVNSNFIYQWLVSENGRKKAISLAKPAVNQASISTTELRKVPISIPTYEEQTAIAKVLQAADKEISLLKTKAEKLREQKKGLMQVLLTGKVRLKIKE